jgi:hypothetical protein
MKFDAECNSENVCTRSDVHICGNSPYEWSLAQAQLLHMNGHLHRHNCCICRQEGPREMWEHMQDCAIVTVWCGLIQDLFVLLKICLIDQEEGCEILFQVPGAPPHFGEEVRSALNVVFHNLQKNAVALTKSGPLATGCILFGSCRLCRDPRYMSSEGGGGARERERNKTNVATVAPEMLPGKWQEIEHRLGVQRYEPCAR